MSTAAFSVLLALPLALSAPRASDPLATVAERSGFTRTATHAEVVDLAARLTSRFGTIRLLELGRSAEGRSLPLLVLADPPLATAAEARERGNPVVLLFGNIHAGEVCGKEALLWLARELASEAEAAGDAEAAYGAETRTPLLARVTVCIAPILNADGNERMAPDNRPGQVGPDEMGTRANAQGLDLNRDWVKLDAPETRALVGFLNEWDPHLACDTHTTNGSLHRYVLTWAPPLCPAGDPEQIAFVRDELLPTVAERLFERTGHATFPYGNFDAEYQRWSTYSGLPRFGGPYRGLRGQMSVLSEAYAYAPYADRVRATKELCRELLAFAAAEPGRAGLIEAWSAWRARFEREPRAEERGEAIAVRFELASSGRATVRGRDADHDVEHFDHFAPTETVARPLAYAVPAELADVLANLERHGIELEALAEPRSARVEARRVRALERAERPYQGRHRIALDVDPPRTESRTLPAGSVLVRAWQPLGNLAVYLLEPQSEDGLAAWSLLGDALAVDADFPIVRVLALD